MSRYVVAIDQGTTGTTVLLVDEGLRVCSRGYAEFAQIYPQPGWVEHDPEAIWKSVLDALSQCLGGSPAQPAEIAAIGITNQRETTLCIDEFGQPLHNAIVWQDRRTADECARLRQAGHEPMVRTRTGLLFDPYFSGTKMAWLLSHVPDLRARAESGKARLGTVDTFLIHRLSGGTAWVTDGSNASRTLLFDLHKLDWDDELCRLLGVPRAALPHVVPSQGVCAETRGVPGLRDGIPIAGVAGDQQAALFGQLCHTSGEAKCTYGTGAFLLMNTGARPVPSQRGLLTTLAWLRPAGGDAAYGASALTAHYALEGSAFIAGAMVQWLRDGLGIIKSAAEIEPLAASVPDSGGVVAVPALSGLGAPHWRPEARGLLTGVTRGTTRAHLARAVLEGIALQNCDLLGAMEADAGICLSALRVDGGAAQNNLLMQLQADLLGVEIVRPKMVETTALGAALLAGLGAGLWTSEAGMRNAWEEDRRWSPKMLPSEVAAMKNRWAEAVKRA
jgi:glycerol kinase